MSRLGDKSLKGRTRIFEKRKNKSQADAKQANLINRVRVNYSKSKRFADFMQKQSSAIDVELTKITREIAGHIRALAPDELRSLENALELSKVLSADSLREFSHTLENTRFHPASRDPGIGIRGYLILLKLILSTNRPNFLRFAKFLSEVTSEIASQQTLIMNHRWAVYVHGKIQTRISSSALAIKQAQLKGDASELFAVVKNLLELLDAPLKEFLSPSRNLENEIEVRLAPWKGLVDFEVFIQPVLAKLENPWVRVTGEVIEELISNSVRHGQANYIRLEVWSTGQKAIHLRAEDNSEISPQSNKLNQGGLGTTIFNAASLGRWSLVRDEKRAKTVFNIEIDRTSNFEFIG